MKGSSTITSVSLLTDEIRQALTNAQKPIEEASCLPAACYHDQSVLEAEKRAIFHQQWIGLGRADRFSEAGQYETLQVADVPLILILDRDLTLHAFNNACRHRGARLLEGQGKTRSIRCPFHCWNYSVDGRLVAASHMEQTQHFNMEDMGLVEFALRIHAGFIFVCFDPEPPDFETFIGNFDQLHAPWPMAELVSTRRVRMEAACNWKLFLDVFNEYYHLPYVHPDSINSIYQAPMPGTKRRVPMPASSVQPRAPGHCLNRIRPMPCHLFPGCRVAVQAAPVTPGCFPT